MKSSAYPPPPPLFCRQPSYMDYPNFYKKILNPPSMIFQKYQPPINKGGGVHTMKAIFCQQKCKSPLMKD